MKTRQLILLCCGVTFISTVSALMCETCLNKTAATCSGRSVKCASAVTSCSSSLTQVMYEGINIQISEKSCGYPGICHIDYSFTLNDTHIAAKAQCCKADNCNTDVPQIPPRNLTKNGLKCPYCVHPALGGCTPQHHIQCTGLEKWCIKFSGHLSLGDSPSPISYEGCATLSACPATTGANHGNGISCRKAAHDCAEEADPAPPGTS
ncbi:phospholipase A2 inhibitor NAI-like [Engystomops pustulosus]|uniref:phospholipase A2 inhibitor NAI-like n=1 Tax=Engystomops pustulosus TaxID=76066 RepID=UPI003AFACBA9